MVYFHQTGYIRFYRIDGEQIFDFNTFYGNLTTGDLNNDELMGWHPRGNFITVENPENISEITITVTADGFTKTFTISDMEEDFDYWVLDYIYSIRLTNEIIKHCHYIYQNIDGTGEEAIITDVQTSFDIQRSVISYTISATSTATLTLSGCYNFGGRTMKPSEEIFNILAISSALVGRNGFNV